ncbi:hypothetical protein NEIG_02372 [Nematocida sp. ERTm5]|nr:hypothetical protein NEIRO03_2212 [Nematocida sp. AWRm78]OAG31287.1 hypothetical protein NEIG_02372 [Nematocida sp. ERTm5]
MSQRISHARCKAILKAIECDTSEDNPKLFTKLYGLLVMSIRNKYTDITESVKSRIISVYKKNKGFSLFISGEFLNELIPQLNGDTLDSDKEYLEKILKVKLGRKKKSEVEIKEFEEFEPALKTSEGSVRGGKGSTRRRIKSERSKAKIESADYIRKKRREDKEYYERLKRMEGLLKKQ